MRTIIIDDEPKAAKMLEIELKNLFPEIEIVGTYQQAELGILAIDEKKPDLLFLDIEMPKQSGFDVLKNCQFRKMQVIFVTAYSEYALQAIKTNALDYILKPIDTEELQRAVIKAKQKIEEQKFNQFQFLLEKLDDGINNFIKIPSGDQILFYKPDEIIFCKAESNYTSVVTTKQKILISKTLKYMEEILPNPIFIRIHQSYIINKNHIRAYSRLDGGYVTLSNGDTARVAKNKKNLVL
ncbi:MAG TPA: response regulator transcription factor [Phaeodactylibacter sp.]|nr:response regulator transcription factor [Phaeodactylibacter sp.]